MENLFSINMGIGDYIWPFDRKFSQIPCAREAGIAGLTGGPGLGALAFIKTNSARFAYKTTVYGGFIAFWATFLYCRYEYASRKKLTKRFQDAYKSGKLD